MKLVLAGGSGHLGGILTHAFEQQGHEVVILGRRTSPHGRTVHWDGRTLGPWAAELEGADAVMNLAGRSVHCRYTPTNLTDMLTSRIDSTRAVGLAIQQAQRPPRVWLQMSTATIYAHRLDAPNDERSGLIDGNEPGAPSYWRFSVEIGKAWEAALAEAVTPNTRKVVLRSSMVMAPGGGAFDMLSKLTRVGLGGPVAGGSQFMSWIHERDFVRAIDLLLEREDIEGPVNLAAPNPVPQRDFMSALRAAWHVPMGLPSNRWMLAIGAALIGTDPELILKSRRVVSQRLPEAGFTFDFPTWPAAAQDLVAGLARKGHLA